MRRLLLGWLAERCFRLGARLTRIQEPKLVFVRVAVIGFTAVPTADQLARAHLGLRPQSAEMPRC